MRILRLCTLQLIGLIASLLMLPPSPTEARDAPARNTLQGSVSVESNVVHFADGLLSVKVHDVALVELLYEVADQAGFRVVPYVALGQRVSLQFNEVPLEQGLLKILRNRSYVLRWNYAAPTPGKRASPVVRPETLWILPQRDERYSNESVRLKRADIDSEVSRLQSALSTGTTEDREEAAIELGQRGHASAVAPLAQALADSDVEVRQAAIESLVEVGGADSARALEVALRDTDPRIREAAVNALGDIGGAMAIDLLQQAQADEIAFVRQAAAETLDHLRGAAR